MTYSRRRMSPGGKPGGPEGGLVDCIIQVIETKIHVTIGVRLDAGDLGVCQRPLHFSRADHLERPRRPLHAFDEQRPRRDDRSRAYVRAAALAPAEPEGWGQAA